MSKRQQEVGERVHKQGLSAEGRCKNAIRSALGSDIGVCSPRRMVSDTWLKESVLHSPTRQQRARTGRDATSQKRQLKARAFAREWSLAQRPPPTRLLPYLLRVEAIRKKRGQGVALGHARRRRAGVQRGVQRLRTRGADA